MVADYVKETGNHVAYRVTPIFEGDDLVASGVQMEAYSVEDNGDGICFNVYCYNVQPGVEINYADGTSKLAPENADKNSAAFVYNKNTKKFHTPECDSVKDMYEGNKGYGNDKELLIKQGYTPCKSCNP